MTAIANTTVGQWMQNYGFQVYGWVDPGGNFSSNTLRKPGGNAPVNYAYIPNTLQLDQAVIYLDRFPDTVQKRPHRLGPETLGDLWQETCTVIQRRTASRATSS